MPNSEEERILACARDLLQQEDSHGSHPMCIVWKRTGRRVWSDYCSVKRDRIILPSSLKGRLSPEEWKPIIASSMMLTQPGEIRQEFLQGFKKIGAMGGLAVGSFTIILAMISFVSGNDLEGIFTGRGGGYSFLVLGLLFVVALVGFVYGRFRQRPYFTRVILEVDLRASSIVGKERFVEVLSKIDSFHLKDVERAKKGDSRFNLRPGISDRISNLRKSPPQRRVSLTMPSQERATKWLTLKRLLYVTMLSRCDILYCPRRASCGWIQHRGTCTYRSSDTCAVSTWDHRRDNPILQISEENVQSKPGLALTCINGGRIRACPPPRQRYEPGVIVLPSAP